MDFFDHQDRSRRRTGWLMFLFALCVLLIVLAVTVVLALGAGALSESPRLLGPIPVYPISMEFFLWSAGLTLMVIASGALYKTAMLSANAGESIARMFGGKFISHATGRSEERLLLNVVEEMAIAAGIAPPRVYLVESPGINAFAAGDSVNSAIIGVTRGGMESLTRQELQGVVAHEFSHIVSGDMVENMRLVGLLHGILIISITGRVIVRSASRGGGRNSGNIRFVALVLGLALVVVGYTGVVFGRLIKSAISRQREFLADATAVQYTRDPSALHGALSKIAVSRHGAEVDFPASEEVAHLFFGDATKSAGHDAGGLDSLFSLLSTHPPVASRMLRLLPAGASGKLHKHEISTSSPQEANTLTKIPGEGANREDKPMSRTLEVSDSEQLPPLSLETGTISLSSIEASRKWVESLPSSISESLSSPRGSAALILALLSSRLPSPEARIDIGAKPDLPSGFRKETCELLPLASRLKREELLPLVELSLSTVRELPSCELEELESSIEGWGEQFGKEDVFVSLVITLIRTRLMTSTGKPSNPPLISSLSSHLSSIRTVLSFLARQGQPTSEHRASEAFAHAMVTLSKGYKPPLRLISSPPLRIPEILPEEDCTTLLLHASIVSLRETPYALRRAFIDACGECVSHDRVVVSREKEMIRVISSVLDCPLPPNLSLLEGPRPAEHRRKDVDRSSETFPVA